MKAIRELLELVPTTDVLTLASTFAEDGKYGTLVNDDTEIVLEFRVGSKSVRLMQAKDIDVDDRDSSYGATRRAALSTAEANQHTPDPPMTVDLQQHLMALAIVG